MPRQLFYIDGAIHEDETAARVPLLDRGYLFGDSVFETLRSYRRVPFRLAAHLQRLHHGLELLGIPRPPDLPTLGDLLPDLCQRVEQEENYLRVTVSRGEGPAGISPEGCQTPRLTVILRPYQPYPAHCYEEGIATRVVSIRKIPESCLPAGVKTGNYLPNILARRELDAAGIIEGIQLAVDGQVVSGTVSNLFLIHGETLRTPHRASGCLPGITRQAILELAPKVGFQVREERLTVEDLQTADEAFFTNTLMECLPVAELEGRRLKTGPKSWTSRLHRAFRELIQALESPSREGRTGTPT